VAVLVQSHCRGRMAQHLLDDLHVRTRRDGQRRCSVSKLMRVQSWEPDRGRGGTEPRAGKRRGPHGSPATHPGKDQVVGRLLSTVLGELVEQKPRNRDVPALMPLRRTPDLTAAVHRRNGLDDRCASTFEIQPTDPAPTPANGPRASFRIARSRRNRRLR